MALRERSDMMLDALRWIDGGKGGDQEASAWTLLACSTASEKTARMACLQAVEMGARWEDLAFAAIETDAPMALSACFDQGGLSPWTKAAAYSQEVVVGAIEKPAVRCLEWMCKKGFEPRASDDAKVYGKDKSWLHLAAAQWQVESIQTLLASRSWSQNDLDEALGALVDALQFNDLRYLKQNEVGPEVAARALVAAGASWEAPAVNLLGKARDPMTIAASLARMRFGKDKACEPRRPARADELWKEFVAGNPNWAVMGEEGARLGALALEQEGFDDARVAQLAFEATPKAERGDLWDALARSCARRRSLSPVIEEAKRWALAGAVEMPGPGTAAILLDACMPKEARMVPGGVRAQEAAEMAEWAYRMGGPAMASAAGECARLLRERSQEERGGWLAPERWPQWEQAILAVAAATPMPPRRSGVQMRL